MRPWAADSSGSTYGSRPPTRAAPARRRLRLDRKARGRRCYSDRVPASTTMPRMSVSLPASTVRSGQRSSNAPPSGVSGPRRSLASPKISPIHDARARRWSGFRLLRKLEMISQGERESGRAGVLDSTSSTLAAFNAAKTVRSVSAAGNREIFGLEAVPQRKDTHVSLVSTNRMPSSTRPGLRVVESEVGGQTPRQVVLEAERDGDLVPVLDGGRSVLRATGSPCRFSCAPRPRGTIDPRPVRSTQSAQGPRRRRTTYCRG